MLNKYNKKWPSNIEDAKALQLKLRQKIRILPLRKTPKYIAAADAGFKNDDVIGAVCVYDYENLEYICHETAMRKAVFPYIPGYLSFREGPVIIGALKNLKIKPDVIIFDGQGIAHPNGIGIASHIGILLDTPTIGCAKSRLIGSFKEPGKKKGMWTPLIHNKEIVGAVLRTKDNVKPLFVSPGHKIDIKQSIEIVLRCTGAYRIPIPQRCADMLTKKP